MQTTITPYSSAAEPTTPPPAVTGREAAYLDVRLPSDAKLYVEGVEMSQTGYLRQFVSPPLDPYRKSTYNLRATWEENGKPVDVPIRAGELLLLPANVPHSPQRFPDTVGLVVERQRRPGERDGFQWYCENCGNLLYEEFFELTNIETQLAPVFERFFSSLERRTCSRCGTVMERKG